MRPSKTVCTLLLISLFGLTGCAAPAKSSHTTDEFRGYPITTNVTLEYWMPLGAGASATVTNMGDTPFAAELERQTGVHIKYLHPAAGTEEEQFNVMLASGKLPDIIETKWQLRPGGIAKAIIDEHIIPLNGLLEYHSPNLWSFLQSHPDINHAAQTSTGQYAVYPFIRNSEALLVYYGPIVRKDWLDAVGLDIPETMDDWHTMLKAFKDKLHIQAPLIFLSDAPVFGAFTGAFGVKQDFYLENGAVKYGPLEPGYREYLQTMAQWYSEGLIDQNIAGVNSQILDNAILSERSGATVYYNGAGLGHWLDLKKNNAYFNLTAAPYPVRNHGDERLFGHQDQAFSSGGNAAISTSCKDVVLAARFLDYGYTPEGQLLYNFGIPDVSYTLRDGEPVYKDELLHDPVLSIDQSLGLYVRATSNGPFIQDARYIQQYMQYPQQKDALQQWQSKSKQTNLPILAVDPLQSAEISDIMTNVTGYVNEQSMKFIMGVRPFEQYDAFVNMLHEFGIDRVIEIYNSTLKEGGV